VSTIGKRPSRDTGVDRCIAPDATLVTYDTRSGWSRGTDDPEGDSLFEAEGFPAATS